MVKICDNFVDMGNDKKIVYSIENLIKHLKHGNDEGKDLLIPEYQRDYVWEESKIPLLLDSIYKGYPIGAIVTWEDIDNNCIHLLDGLQRSFSIVKIDRDFDKYVTLDLFKRAIEKVDKERYFAAYKTDVFSRAAELVETINKEGLDSTIEGFDAEASKVPSEKEVWTNINILLSKALRNIKKFKEEDFYKYKIDRIQISNKLKKKDVTVIFERLNSEGKKLNKFEVYTSIWSNHRFELNDNIVKNFITERNKRYANALGVDHDKMHIRKSDNNINPADYVYAILIHILNKTRFFKEFFIKKNDEDIDTLRNIEELSYIFLNYFGLSDSDADFKILGEEMKKEFMSNPENSQKFIDIVYESIVKVEDNLRVFSFAKANSKDYSNVKNTLNISTHILVSMVNQIVNKIKGNINISLKENQLDFWLISETVDKVYGSSSGKKGIAAVEDNRYIKDMPKNLPSKIKQFVENEEDKKLKSISSGTKLIISYLQKAIQVNSSTNLHLDHVIPKSKLLKNNIDKKIHTLYNVQLLDSKLNIDKSDLISTDDYQFDDLINNPVFQNISNDAEYLQKLEPLLHNIELNYEDFYEYRKKIIDKIIDKEFK